MIPSFSYMGGKAKIRRRICNYFPLRGTRYVEPFAGLGNMFFEARSYLKYESWLLNDINPFLSILQVIDLELLPDTIDYFMEKYSSDPIRKILEPKITFAGKGYDSGKGTDRIATWNRDNYKARCNDAQKMLTGVEITTKSWQTLNYLDSDLVYFDPPYYDTEASYQNINHLELIKFLNQAKFKWVLSGYNNSFYNMLLVFKRKIHFEKMKEFSFYNDKKKTMLVETIWLNY